MARSSQVSRERRNSEGRPEFGGKLRAGARPDP